MSVQILDTGGDKQSYVVAGAVLGCSFGSEQSKLKTPFSHGVYIKNKAQMNIKDFTPLVHIMPFGKCSSLSNPTVAAATAANNGVLKEMPCIPVVTMPWINGKADVLIDEEPALLNKCTNQCMYCGTISIQDDGQE
ncbi:DUF4280 domain-containing protein [Brevibacillus dissolubilis]|uniref:DUF4280 domain-containing protein n=1 Tax=Brevibacillus dissolubilis TaxID=1844116 RepID=UPI0011170A61|nr:DUF4280 domain-containing protein [Brevibacillus dissolubilis]